jgi:hypothetical protein
MLTDIKQARIVYRAIPHVALLFALFCPTHVCGKPERLLHPSPQADDLKRFDRDRAITAHLHRTGKGHDGGDGPWDDNVHSIRGLEDFLKISGCNHVIQPFRPPSPTDPAPPPPRDAPARGAAAAAARGRATAATTTASAAERERREHARLVLSEQDRLRSPLGPDAPPADPAALAEASSRSSDGPRREALERGREDAAVAARLAGSDDAVTTSRLQAVRGRLHALIERPPSVRSLLALDRQGSLRSLVAGVVGGGGVASSAPGSGAATPLPHHQHHPLPPPAAGGAAARFLGPSDRQPSLRSLLGRGGGIGSGADR